MKKNICIGVVIIFICFVLAWIIGGNFEFLIGYMTSNVGASISDNIGSLDGPVAQFVTSDNIVLNLFVLFLLLSIIIALLYNIILKIIILIKRNTKN